MRDEQALHRGMMAWRHELHAHPEFGFETTRTAAFVADKLRAFGMDEVVEGVGGTGVVATLTRGRSNRAIALRADMDALRITEQGARSYGSTNPGHMHACGHDGHTAMLLGAAKVLAEDGGFDGTVRFVFQPAEEWGKGALAMIEDGLLERFPFEEIYGLHNMPGYPAGQFRTRAGALMSAEDNFEIVLTGVGGHASAPHAGRETMVAGAALVLNLQTIVSRRLDPTQAAVLSVTEFVTDGARNVLPGEARIRGDVRTFNGEVSDEVEAQMRKIAEGIALTYNVSAKVDYTREFVPLINDAACAEAALAAARRHLGEARVAVAAQPITASEDFARFLDHVPGCFAFIGNGVDTPPLHNPSYDFDDAILLDGAMFFTEIARQQLAVSSA
ncbi:MAG TPA: M20 aminoacylase family protein [Caulobacteraceae bacterium]|nr:M20 aminoacylase family protein [Caulobacteraceae bacterium]